MSQTPIQARAGRRLSVLRGKKNTTALSPSAKLSKKLDSKDSIEPDKFGATANTLMDMTFQTKVEEESLLESPQEDKVVTNVKQEPETFKDDIIR